MYPYSFTFFNVDFIFFLVDFADFVEVYLFICLLSHLDEVGHVFIRYSQIDKFSATFPCDKL